MSVGIFLGFRACVIHLSACSEVTETNASVKFGMPIAWTIRTNVLKFQVNVTVGAAVSACAANRVWSKNGAFSTDPTR